MMKLKEEKDYPCPNCDEDKPDYRGRCPECDYEDKKAPSRKEK